MALELRKNGATLTAIANQLGYSHASAAHEAIRTALERIPDPDVRTYRKMMAERYEKMLFSCEAAAFNPDHRNHGVAAANWFKAMIQLQKLWGVDIEPEPNPKARPPVGIDLNMKGAVEVKPLSVIVHELTPSERQKIWEENRAKLFAKNHEYLKRMTGGEGPSDGGEEIDQHPEGEQQPADQVEDV